MQVEKISIEDDWLGQLDKRTRIEYKSAIKFFINWSKTSFEELVRDYKNSEDKVLWSREMANLVLRFQNEMLETVSPKTKKPYSRNYVRNIVVVVSSFFSTECQPLTFRKGKTIKVSMAQNEHSFSIQDLRKMFDCADLRDKTVLACAISLGFSVSDFLSLKREFVKSLIERAKSENLDFIDFQYQREKTNEKIMGILNPTAIEYLTQYLAYTEKDKKSEFLFDLTAEAISDILNRLADKSGIVKIGNVHFHALRKFLLSTLSNCGLNEFEVKTVLGKKIPISDLTYLQGIKESAFEKYKGAFPKFTLVGNGNGNGKIEGLKETVLDLQKKVVNQDMVNKTLTEKITELETDFEVQQKEMNKANELIQTFLEAFKAHEELRKHTEKFNEFIKRKFGYYIVEGRDLTDEEKEALREYEEKKQKVTKNDPKETD